MLHGVPVVVLMLSQKLSPVPGSRIGKHSENKRLQVSIIMVGGIYKIWGTGGTESRPEWHVTTTKIV